MQKEKEHNKKGMEAQLVVQTMSIQEKDKSNLSPRRTKLCLMCSFGRKIVIQGRKRHYIKDDIRLVEIDRDGSYSDLVTQISSIFCISSCFMIKCQPPGESLKYLIIVTSDKDLLNIFDKQECLSVSPRSTPHLHFVLPMQPSLPLDTKFKVMSGASIKINVIKNGEKLRTKGDEREQIHLKTTQ